jgi:hypothetical protein
MDSEAGLGRLAGGGRKRFQGARIMIRRTTPLSTHLKSKSGAMKVKASNRLNVHAVLA